MTPTQTAATKPDDERFVLRYGVRAGDVLVMACLSRKRAEGLVALAQVDTPEGSRAWPVEMVVFRREAAAPPPDAEVLRLRQALGSLRDDMHRSIDHCCDEKAGQKFCESYGCGTLLKYIERIDNALSAPSRYADSGQKIREAACPNCAAVRHFLLVRRSETYGGKTFAVDGWVCGICGEILFDEPRDDAIVSAALSDRGTATGVEQLRDVRLALSELVRLKDGPRDAYYQATKENAWQCARAALSASAPAAEPTTPNGRTIDDAASECERILDETVDDWTEDCDPGWLLTRITKAREALDDRPAKRCKVPPPGWTCSRHAGHSGPCAASPAREKARYGFHDLTGMEMQNNLPSPAADSEQAVSQDKPSAETIVQAIALADGVLSGHPSYLTKLQMIHICKRWLEIKQPAPARCKCGRELIYSNKDDSDPWCSGCTMSATVCDCVAASPAPDAERERRIAEIRERVTARSGRYRNEVFNHAYVDIPWLLSEVDRLSRAGDAAGGGWPHTLEQLVDANDGKLPEKRLGRYVITQAMASRLPCPFPESEPDL